jgi:hypothetical protein
MKTLKEKILQEHGLTEVRPGKRKHKKLVHIAPTRQDSNKTTHMKLLERLHGKPIEELLLSGSLSYVAKLLDIDTSTASKWIKRLKLRYTKDNLPDCNGCPARQLTCVMGVCTILMEHDQWDLVELKQKEVLNEGD